jgi:hypothetical protein
MKPVGMSVNKLIGDETDQANEDLTRAIIDNKNPHQLVIL